MLKLHRRNAQLTRLKLIKNGLSIVGTIVVAHTSMVAAYDKVRAAVVLTNQRVENRLPWACVAHSRRVNRQNHSLLREIMLHHDFVAAHPHICRDVVTLGRAHKRVQKESIHRFKRTLLNVFVGAVNWVTRLKTNYSFPAALAKLLTRLSRIDLIVREERMWVAL